MRLMKFGIAVLIALAHFGASSAARACSFTLRFSPPTLREDVADSKIILLGTFTNPRLVNGEPVTDFHITKVIRSHPLIQGKKTLAIPRHIDVKDEYLIFGEVFKKEADFFRGIETDKGVTDYVEGLLKLDAKDRVAALRYCFAFLDHPSEFIARDARLEFEKASWIELGQARRDSWAQEARKRLQVRQLDRDRQELYVSLLGVNGQRDDAAMIRKLLDAELRNQKPTFGGKALVGYTLVDQPEGWKYILNILGQPTRDFAARFAAVQACRQVDAIKPALVAEQDVLRAYALILADPELADFAVNDLANRRTWSLTNRILGYFDKELYDAPITRNSIIRYALQCPEPAARRFIEKQRKADPEMVEENEEILKLMKEGEKSKSKADQTPDEQIEANSK